MRFFFSRIEMPAVCTRGSRLGVVVVGVGRRHTKRSLLETIDCLERQERGLTREVSQPLGGGYPRRHRSCVVWFECLPGAPCRLAAHNFLAATCDPDFGLKAAIPVQT